MSRKLFLSTRESATLVESNSGTKERGISVLHYKGRDGSVLTEVWLLENEIKVRLIYCAMQREDETISTMVGENNG